MTSSSRSPRNPSACASGCSTPTIASAPSAPPPRRSKARTLTRLAALGLKGEGVSPAQLNLTLRMCQLYSPAPNGLRAYEQQTPGTQIQDQQTSPGEFMGTAEEPAQPPRIRSGAARPAAQEAFGFWYAARREAKTEGLLRQYLRAPVPPALRGGGAPPRRHWRQSDRAARAASRCGRLSHEIRADTVRRASAGQPQARARQR